MPTHKFKFVNFYKLYFPLTYNPEIGTKVSAGESESHLTSFFNLMYTKKRKKAGLESRTSN